MAFLQSVFKRGSKKDEVKSESIEADFMDSLKYVDSLCNSSMNLQKEKLKEEKKLLDTIELLDQLKKYDDVDPNDLELIDKLMVEYQTLTREKESLKSDLMLNEKKYEDFRKYEDTIDDSIKEIRNYEDNRDKLSNDLNYLKAEQGALKFEDEKLHTKFKTVENLFYGVLLSTCVFVIVFSGLYFILGESIILPGTVIAVIIIFWIMWLFMIEGDLKLDLEKNKLKQEKVVKMINKVKIKIVNLEADLSFQYKKYDVSSSAALKNKWVIYKQMKSKRLQYNEVFTDYFDIYEKIEDILNKYNIVFDDEISVLKELTDKKEKIKLKESTEKEIILTKNKIEKITKEQTEVINKLKFVRENDDSENGTLKDIIDSYLSQFNEDTDSVLQDI